MLRRELADGVLTISLDRPDRLNGPRQEMVHRLTDGVAAAGIGRDVVVTAAGRAFCSHDIVGGKDDCGTDMKPLRRRILDVQRGPTPAPQDDIGMCAVSPHTRSRMSATTPA